MRVFCAGLLGRSIVLLHLWRRGSFVHAAESSRLPVTEQERECCVAMLDEAADMVFAGEFGGSLVPLACFKHQVGCPALGVEAYKDAGASDALEKAIRQQVDLRSRPSCDASEWEGRCPSGSTMLLADQRGRCLAAGCIQLEREEAATTTHELEGHPEQEILRAAVTKESRRLREASTGAPPSFYSHCRHLRKKFAKAERNFFKQLKAATASVHPNKIQKVRLLLEEARFKGFRGAKIEEARIAMRKRDHPRLLRRVLGMALSKAARVKSNVRNKVISEKRTTSLVQEVQTLSGTVTELRHAAHVDMVGQVEAAAARDLAQVHLASCSARAHDLDSKSADLEDFVAVQLLRQHLMSANQTSLPLPSGPDDQSPVEAVFARTSARFTQVKNMAVSFTADMKAILDQSAAEIGNLKQQVRDLEETSTVLKERAELAQLNEQNLAQEYGRRLAVEAAAAELDAELVSCEEKLSAFEVAVLALLILVFWQRRANPAAAEEDQVPRPLDEEARADQPPAPLPPESALGSTAATAAAAAAAAAPLPGSSNAQGSGRVEVLAPPANLIRDVPRQEDDAGPAAAVEYASAMDAGGLEQEAEEGVAQRAAALDEAHPLQELRAISAPNLAVDAAATPQDLANDNFGTGPSAHTTSGQGVGAAPAAGTENAVRWPRGMEQWVFRQWRRGDIKRRFRVNVALQKGGASAELKFAEEALEGGWALLRLRDRLGNGGFGEVDIVERVDDPEKQFALKRISGDTADNKTVSAAIEMLLFCSLVADLARGAAHVHSLGFIHRDIKPENVLFFETAAGVQGKLADFGISRVIGDMCQGRLGTPGYMAYESMSKTSVVCTAAHDVVGVAVVLLEACLHDDQLCPNLFAREAFHTPNEEIELRALRDLKALGHDMYMKLLEFKFEVASRTMLDGTFNNWLAADKLHPAIRSPAELIEQLPSFLAADPAERGNMDGLCALARWMHRDNS